MSRLSPPARLILACALAATACSDPPGTEGDDGTQTGTDADTDTGGLEQCVPTGGGPHWLLEGETVEFQITCTAELELSGSDFEITLPSGASYDPATATFSWTPALDQAAVHHLEITALPTAEQASVEIGVADHFLHPQNIPVVDPLTYTEEYGLPVLFLYNHSTINSDFYAPAAVVYGGVVYTMESKYRGQSSLAYPKKSYTLKFAKEQKFTDLERDFLEKRKLVLTSTFDDNSHIRQRLAFELWNRLDPEHIQIQAYNVVVFLEGEYWGLYMIGDHVDGYLMEDHGLWQDGNLYKARTHDANFRLTNHDGNPKATLHDGYTKSEGFPPEPDPAAFEDLEALVEFVATSSDADFAANLGAIVDQRDYEDWWICVTAMSAQDSAGKNSYHYHDPNAGLWRMAPWDFNASFGQNWLSERTGFEENPEMYRNRNEMFARMLDDPTIGADLRARYMATLQDQYALVDLLALIAQWKRENLACALRDESLWGEEYINFGRWAHRTDFLTHEQEIDYVRDWTTMRWGYLAGLY